MASVLSHSKLNNNIMNNLKFKILVIKTDKKVVLLLRKGIEIWGYPKALDNEIYISYLAEENGREQDSEEGLHRLDGVCEWNCHFPQTDVC